MAGLMLKVTPEELQTTSDAVKTQMGAIERNWRGLCEIVDASGAYWEGDAGDCGRRLLANIREDVQTIIKRLNEHPTDLLKMAGIYKDTESKAADMANTLPDNVIT